MIAAFVAAQALAGITYSPALVFLGERFEIHAPAEAVLSDGDGMDVWKQGKRWFGKADLADSSFNAAIGDTDAALVRPPIAAVPRWRRWPSVSSEHDGVEFLISAERKVALMPMPGNFGIVVADAAGERRWPHIIVLDVAVRSGPRHTRPFYADYLYSGSSAISLLATPAKVASLSLRVTPARAELDVVARYRMAGTIRLMGTAKDVSLGSGEAVSLRFEF
ncbi:MAG: hypothetical protein ACR2HJ_10325 [Fimbriimonadales bacterium]